MKLTNRMNLPAPLARAVAKSVENPHNKPGEYSVTTLQNGIREVILTNRHFEEITTDVADEIWAVFGTAVHSLLEREHQSGDGSVAEIPLRLPLDGGGAVTGTADLFTPASTDKPAVVEDYKTCKAYGVIYPELPEKWRKQILSYCALLDTRGVYVRKGRVVAFIKDWTPRDAYIKKSSDYPQSPCVTLEWNYTDSEVQQSINDMKARAIEFRGNEQLPDSELPLCTTEERWEKPTVYAIKKPEHKRSTKNCDNKAEAEQVLATDPKFKGKGYIIDERIGESTKCRDYCRAKEFCEFYKTNVLPTLEVPSNE